MMIDFACRKFEIDEIIKCGFGLTKADFRVMRKLADEGESYTAEALAKSLSLDLSTVQRAVKRLHEKRIVLRNQENLEGGGYVYHYRTVPKKRIRAMIREIICNWTEHVEGAIERW
jgi:predicted transcriptional regulator